MRPFHLILIFLLTVSLFSFSNCSSKRSTAYKHQQSYNRHYAVIINAERKATHAGQRVLRTAREMSTSGEIIRGACWDYLNTAYLRAGYPHDKRQRVYLSRKSGPYAPAHMIRPGDWLYYINHSYNGIEHSGMFIDWIDRDRHIALILSYAGERRREAARYKRYDLSNVYSIMRPVD
jgi:hypothetical protein